MEITQSSYAPFSNLDIPQNGVTGDRTYNVWSRSLFMGLSSYACGVGGRGGGHPCYGSVNDDGGVVSCFCIGSETAPPVPLK